MCVSDGNNVLYTLYMLHDEKIMLLYEYCNLAISSIHSLARPFIRCVEYFSFLLRKTFRELSIIIRFNFELKFYATVLWH